MQLDIFEDDVPSMAPEVLPQNFKFERNMARAAEFLVAADISMRGWDCFQVGEALRYDLIADIQGLRRIQVKSCRQSVLKAPGSVLRSYTFCKGNDLRSYVDDVDLFALVGLDVRRAIYILPSSVKRASFHIKAAAFSEEASYLSWCAVLNTWGLA